MTLLESYQHLTQPLTMFGKTYPPVIDGELTIEKLQQHAKNCQASHIPALKERGKDINKAIFNARFNLNNEY